MEMILTPDRKEEILNQFISYLNAKVNKEISIPIVFDPYEKDRNLSQAEKFRNFTEMMDREGPVWTDENHPDLNTMEDIDNYVRKIRGQWIKNYE